MKRMGQALQVRQLVDSIFDQYGEQADRTEEHEGGAAVERLQDRAGERSGPAG